MPRKQPSGDNRKDKPSGPRVEPAERAGRARWCFNRRCRHAKKEMAILGNALRDLLDAQPYEEARRAEAVTRAIATLAMVQSEFLDAVSELELVEADKRRKARCGDGHAADAP